MLSATYNEVNMSSSSKRSESGGTLLNKQVGVQSPTSLKRLI